MPPHESLCRGEDSNLHQLPDMLLRHARLPISPPRLIDNCRGFVAKCPRGPTSRPGLEEAASLLTFSDK